MPSTKMDLDIDIVDVDNIDIDHLVRPNAGAGGGYVWEAEYKRSWDVIQEDEHGSLQGVVASLQREMKRKRLLHTAAQVQRGLIRHLCIVLDLSKAMLQTDMKPNNIELSLSYLEAFIAEFFDQNPLSHASILTTCNGLASTLSALSGTPTDHLKALKNRRVLQEKCEGEASLQNSLEMARSILANVPQRGSKEILFLWGGLTTVDPGDISETIRSVKSDGIRVSIVGLSAEIKIIADLAKETSGTYTIPLSEPHMRELLFDHIPPPPLLSSSPYTQVAVSESPLIMMGFPTRIQSDSLCACHSSPTGFGYICPRCFCKLCSLPSECVVCGLMLVSSPHLARSYHHLWPVEGWRDVLTAGVASNHCYSCLKEFDHKRSLPEAVATFAIPIHQKEDALAPAVLPATPKAAESFNSSSKSLASLFEEKSSVSTAEKISSAPSHSSPRKKTSTDSGRYDCPKCRHQFCFECDLYVHEVLRNCPGCV